MRKQLFGSADNNYHNREDFNKCEKLVSKLLHEQTRHLLLRGYNIVLDNTHLSEKYIEEVFFNYNHMANIEILFFYVDYDIATQRLKEREGANVNLHYLEKQYKAFKVVKEKYKKQIFTPKVDTKYYPSEPNLPKCCIIDLDGTLSLFDKKVKSPYNRDFENDEVNIPVLYAIKEALRNNIQIIFFSGRQNIYRDTTMLFLTISCELNEDNFKLFMRDTDDFRSDDIIKMELFDKHIRDKYEVIFAIDDRLQVIEGVWNKLDIRILSANQTNERF
jgi:predicted kinase